MAKNYLLLFAILISFKSIGQNKYIFNGSGNWSDTANWNMYPGSEINNNDTVVINSIGWENAANADIPIHFKKGSVFIIEYEAIFLNDKPIEFDGKIINNFLLYVSNDVIFRDSLINNFSISQSYIGQDIKFTISDSSVFLNNGAIENILIMNYGTIINKAKNQDPGFPILIMENKINGLFINEGLCRCFKLNNYGTVINNYVMENSDGYNYNDRIYSIIENLTTTSRFINNGILTGYGDIVNSGKIINNNIIDMTDYSIIYNYDTIYNNGEITLDSSTSIVNGGVENMLDNPDFEANISQFPYNPEAVIYNDSTINLGVFYNNAKIINEKKGIINITEFLGNNYFGARYWLATISSGVSKNFGELINKGIFNIKTTIENYNLIKNDSLGIINNENNISLNSIPMLNPSYEINEKYYRKPTLLNQGNINYIGIGSINMYGKWYSNYYKPTETIIYPDSIFPVVINKGKIETISIVNDGKIINDSAIIVDGDFYGYQESIVENNNKINIYGKIEGVQYNFGGVGIVYNEGKISPYLKPIEDAKKIKSKVINTNSLNVLTNKANTYNPNDIGVISFENYAGNGEIEIQLQNDENNQAHYDSIYIGSKVHLTGKFTLLPDYEAEVGEYFTVIKSDSAVGTFSEINMPLNWNILYNFPSIGDISIRYGNPCTLDANVIKQDLSCFNGTNGIIKINTTGAFGSCLYTINDNTPQVNNIFNNLKSGNYNITIKDENYCIVNKSVEIISTGDSLKLNINKKDLTCFNNNDGEINIIATGSYGSYKYAIDNMSYTFNNNFNKLDGGLHTIRVKDYKGCTIDTSIELYEPTKLELNSIQTNVSCFGFNDGAITPQATGGVPAYKYTIEPKSQMSDGVFSNLYAGKYKIYVTDNNGCNVNKSIVISQPKKITYYVNKKDISNCYQDGIITINAQGGSGNLSYSINDGQTWESSNTYSNLAPNRYTIKVKDDNNCFANSNSVTLIDNGSDQYESNNTVSNAKFIQLNNNIDARIGKKGDIDWYYFNTNSISPGFTYLTFTKSQINLKQGFDIYEKTGNNIKKIQTSSIGNNLLNIFRFETKAYTTYLIKIYGDFSLECYRLNISNINVNYNSPYPFITNEKIRSEKNEEIKHVPFFVNVFPNPASNLLNIAINGANKSHVNIRITNSVGHIINSWMVIPNSNIHLEKLEINKLAPGMYFIEINNNNNKEIINFLKY